MNASQRFIDCARPFCYTLLVVGTILHFICAHIRRRFMTENDDLALFHVLWTLRKQLTLQEQRAFYAQPKYDALIEENIAEMIRSGTGPKWLQRAASLYQSRNSMEATHGAKLLSSFIKQGMAHEVVKHKSLIEMAVAYFDFDESLNRGSDVLIPLADAGQSKQFTKYPRVFHRCAEMLTSRYVFHSSQAYHLVTHMGEDNQADAIARHAMLKSAIIDAYLNDDPGQILRSEHMLEVLIRKEKDSVIANDPDVMGRTLTLLTEKEYREKGYIPALGLAAAALNSESGEDVKRSLGPSVVKNVEEASKNFPLLLDIVKRSDPTTIPGFTNCTLGC